MESNSYPRLFSAAVATPPAVMSNKSKVEIRVGRHMYVFTVLEVFYRVNPKVS